MTIRRRYGLQWDTGEPALGDTVRVVASEQQLLDILVFPESAAELPGKVGRVTKMDRGGQWADTSSASALSKLPEYAKEFAGYYKVSFKPSAALVGWYDSISVLVPYSNWQEFIEVVDVPETRAYLKVREERLEKQAKLAAQWDVNSGFRVGDRVEIKSKSVGSTLEGTGLHDLRWGRLFGTIKQIEQPGSTRWKLVQRQYARLPDMLPVPDGEELYYVVVDGHDFGRWTFLARDLDLANAGND